MPNYTLNIEIDAESLKKIYASNEKLTLVKQTDPSQTEVAWVAFYPFENNTVQWTESYAVYASQTELTAGTTIKKVSTRSAADQNAYAFAQGSFDLATPKQSLGKGQYQVINEYTDMLVFGLAQDVVANGSKIVASPINAQNVPNFHFATFTPFEKVKIYLHASAMSGMVLTEVASDVCVVTFGGDVTTISVRYEPSTGNFVQL